MSENLFAAYAQGLALMAGLILAIGPQNAFVLRQGLKGRGFFIAATVCFFCDAMLVSVGAAGLGALFATNQMLRMGMTLAGAVFLTWYGLRSLHAAKTAKGLDLTMADQVSRASTVLTGLAVSLLNPHVYVDTLMLVGGLAGRYEGMARIAFALGAISVSFVWFYSLAYGARWLAPILTKPKIWRIMDLIIGMMMLSLAVGLVWDGVQAFTEYGQMQK